MYEGRDLVGGSGETGMLASHLQCHCWVGKPSGLPFYIAPCLTLFRIVSSPSTWTSVTSLSPVVLVAEERCLLSPRDLGGLLLR